MSAVHDLNNELRDWGGFIQRLKDLAGDDDRAFLDTLEGETEVTDAARRVVRWMAEQGAAADAMKALSDSYLARVKVFDGRVEGARNALFHLLQFLGLPSMPLPEATLSIRQGVTSLAGEADPAELPDDLVRIKREADRTAIKAALEAGRVVPGYALSNGAPSLSVRVR